MFYRTNSLCLSLVFALCASAASVGVRTYGQGQPTVNCNANTGTEQCCNGGLASVTDPLVKTLSGLLGINLGSITADVGLSCTPIVGADQCNSQAVCCTGNTFSGLVTIGCSPINVGL